MKYNYMVEHMQITDAFLGSWKWKQIALGNDLESLKHMTGNKGRIIDLATLQEVYGTYPDRPSISMFS